MKIKLIDDWQAVARKAWSMKFNLLAALLGAGEVAVQLYQPPGIASGAFAGFATGVSLAAAISRLIAQQELSGGANGNEVK